MIWALCNEIKSKNQNSTEIHKSIQEIPLHCNWWTTNQIREFAIHWRQVINKTYQTVRAVNKAHHKIKLMTQSLSLTHLDGIKSTAFQSELICCCCLLSFIFRVLSRFRRIILKEK